MYFCVTAKCGHVGRNFYILKDFAVWAENGREAAEKARGFARVKHHQKDAIRNVVRITEEEFISLREANASDPYLMCKSVQEQNQICSYVYDEIYEEDFVEDKPKYHNRKAMSHKAYLLSKPGKNSNFRYW